MIPGASVEARALHAALLVVTAAVFWWILWRRLALLRRAAPDPRLDRLGERLRRLLVVGLLQSRQPRERVAGWLHIVVFLGFLVLLARSLTLLGEGFVAGFTLPGLGGAAGEAYASVKDWTALAVLLACAVLAARRLLVRPARFHDRHARSSHAREAYLVLGLIALLMVADAVLEGSRLAGGDPPVWRTPLAAAAAACMGSASAGTLEVIGGAGFWVHNVALCSFACFLPLSKHFHVLTALPNVFLSKLPPAGRVKPPRHDADGGAELERIGARDLTDLTWKHLLDVYSCTDCGRCSEACPAYASGTALSPRMLSVKARDEAYAAYPAFGSPRSGRPTLVGEVIAEEEVWACTTCGACEETCPVLIEYIDRVVDMRRFLVDEGRVPPSLQKALRQVERKGNPYGKRAASRGAWAAAGAPTEAPGVRTLKPGDAAELLYFTDSATAYDPRLNEVARALAASLRAAGVDCGILGMDETDSGHEVRRIGEEGLFELLRESNTEALAARRVGRIVTSDPHALNALRNDYDLGVPVLHHSQVLAELVAAGRLELAPLDDERTYAFHDPCYLGRHNGIYDEPRAVLAALGLRTVEMGATRSRSACCGGGSLYLFHESECEERMGERRIAMAEAAGADVVVTACPFCTLHLEDAIQSTGRGGRMEVRDLAELVERARVKSPEESPNEELVPS